MSGDSPFRKPNRIHVFVNVVKKKGQKGLTSRQTSTLAVTVKDFIEGKLHRKSRGAAAGHVWVRTSNQ